MSFSRFLTRWLPGYFFCISVWNILLSYWVATFAKRSFASVLYLVVSCKRMAYTVTEIGQTDLFCRYNSWTPRHQMKFCKTVCRRGKEWRRSRKRFWWWHWMTTGPQCLSSHTRIACQKPQTWLLWLPTKLKPIIVEVNHCDLKWTQDSGVC